MDCLPYFISGTKFCRPCGLGFAADSKLSRSGAYTLGLIISEALNMVRVSEFYKVAQFLNFDSSDIISFADLGVLVHAEVSAKHGTRIIYDLPDWLLTAKAGLEMCFAVQLASAMRSFIENVEKAPWIFPISTNQPRFIASIEDRLGRPLTYTSEWIGEEGIRKLRRHVAEAHFANLSSNREFELSIRRANELLHDVESRTNSDVAILDINDGRIIAGINRKITSTSFNK